MMTIPLKMRLEPDGTLDLHVATGLPASEVDVLVIPRKHIRCVRRATS